MALEEVETFILRRQNTICQYIATYPILYIFGVGTAAKSTGDTVVLVAGGSRPRPEGREDGGEGEESSCEERCGHEGRGADRRVGIWDETGK